MNGWEIFGTVAAGTGGVALLAVLCILFWKPTVNSIREYRTPRGRHRAIRGTQVAGEYGNNRVWHSGAHR